MVQIAVFATSFNQFYLFFRKDMNKSSTWTDEQYCTKQVTDFIFLEKGIENGF